ncbi:MAG: restriction endonuclease subunit S [Dehalococcoidia bacterium]
MMRHWRVKELGDISSVAAGNPAPQDDEWFDEGHHPFFRTSDVGRIRVGTIHESADHLNDKGIVGLRRFPRGTILMPKSGASTFLNHRVVMGVDGFAASHLAAVVADDPQVDHRFLFHFLTTIAAQDLIQEHAYPSLKLADIKSLRVPLPPLSEQRRIVAVLDQAFAGIEKVLVNIESNVADARALFEGYLTDVFSRRGEGWTDKRLREVALDFGRGKSKHRPRNDPRLFGEKYPFIQTSEVRQSNQFIREASKYYSDFGLSQSKLWPKGTVCITIAANIAETGILDFDACFPDSVIGLVVDEEKACNRFVEYALRHMKDVLQAEGKGSAQDNINLRTFETRRFPFPPLPEQVSIADECDAIEQEVKQYIAICAAKRERADELKQSMLHRAFAGKLTETDEAMTLK